MARLKIAALVLVIVVVSLLGAAFVYVRSIDFDRYRDEIAADLGRAIGREVRIGGHLRVDPGLLPRIEVTDLSVANAPGRTPDTMARVGRVTLELRLLRLLRGTIDIRELDIEDVEILLERDAEGHANWPVPTEDAGTDEQGQVRFHIEEGRIDRLAVTYRNLAEGREQTGTLEQVEFDGEGDGLEIDLRLTGVAAGVPFDLEVRLDRESIGADGTRYYVGSLDGSIRSLRMHASGTLEAYDTGTGIDAALELSASDLPSLLPEGGTWVPALGPIRATARITRGERPLAAEDIALEIGERDRAWLGVTGQIADLIEFRGVHLEAEFHAAGLEHLAPLVGDDPPKIGALHGSARLTDRDGSLGIEEFSLRGGHERVLRVDIRGDLDDVLEIDEIDVTGELSAKDLSVIGSVFDVDLDPIGPVELTGQIEGSNEHVQVRRLSVRLDRTHLEGEFHSTFGTGERPQLSAKLSSPIVYLDDLGVEPDPEDAEDSDDEDATQASDRRWIFDESPLALDWLHAVDARLTLRADQVVGRESFAAEDLRAVAVLENGKLTLRPVDLHYKGGSVSGEAVIDAGPDVPEFVLRARAEELRVARVMSQFQEKPELTGTANLVVDLEGRGDSPRALARSLRGTAALTLRDGSIHSSYVAFSTAAALRDMVGFGPREGMTPLHCLLVSVEIEDGVATVQQLVIDTDRMLVAGRGTIRLDDERYELSLAPRAKHATVVDVAVPVKISGKLGSPEIRVKRSGLGRATVDALVDNPLARGAARLLSRLTRSGRSSGPCDPPDGRS